MDNFINFMNDLFHSNKTELDMIYEIIKYYQTNHFNIEWLDDNRLSFNSSNKSPIIETIKLSANVLDKINLSYYYDEIKYGIEIIAIPEALSDEINNKRLINHLKDFFIYDGFSGNSISTDEYNINSYDQTFNCFHDYMIKPNKTKRYIDYDMFNDPKRNFYFLSYFKCAINFIVNHPLFKKYDNREYEELINNKEYETSKYYYNASIKLWKLLSDNKFSEIVNFYNNITDNKCFIAKPNINYHPHKLLQELLHYLGNEFSNMFYRLNQYVLPVHGNIKRNIEFHLSRCKPKSIFIIPPYQFVHFQMWYALSVYDEDYVRQNSIKEELQNLTNDNINSYDYLVNDYYLTSFCFTEYIPGNITYRCVFVKINYDENFNVISKVRYDDKILKYEENKYLFMDNELKMFNGNGINDYYDDKIKYHINLLCYVNKSFSVSMK